MEERAQREIVYGRGPVRELLKGGRPVECLLIQKGLEPSLSPVIKLAKEQGVPIKQTDPRKLEELCQGGNHQGVAAEAAAARYWELEEVLARAVDRPPLLVIADEIEDPHNLGAIIRTAEGAGAHGLILPKRRSAGLSQIVAKTSAGAVEHLPVVRVANIPTLIETLKEKGIWVYGADMAGASYHQTNFSGPAALVLGSEGKGLGRLVRERCDALVSLPMRGRIDSLNVSVAAGILLYEMARQQEGGSPLSTGRWK